MSGASPKGLESTLKKFANLVVSRALLLDESIEQLLFKAFRNVPRHWFVDETIASEAYCDLALPGEFGQLLSKPSVVARMLSLIPNRKGGRVLEIGSGSGYTSALLSAMGHFVYGIEAVGLLCQKTRRRLDSAGIPNILLRPGDGFQGWKDHAPFLAIIVWTPCSMIEDGLFDQLSEDGGVLIAPVGDDQDQILHLWTRVGNEIKQVKFEKISLLEGA